MNASSMQNTPAVKASKRFAVMNPKFHGGGVRSLHSSIGAAYRVVARHVAECVCGLTIVDTNATSSYQADVVHAGLNRSVCVMPPASSNQLPKLPAQRFGCCAGFILAMSKKKGTPMNTTDEIKQAASDFDNIVWQLLPEQHFEFRGPFWKMVVEEMLGTPAVKKGCE